MKPRYRAAIAKLSHGARNLLLSFIMSTKKPTVAIVLAAVTAKCRELWEGLTGSAAVAHFYDDGDYFRWSYEFSCMATPVVPVATGCGRRCRRRLPPCFGGKQERETLMSPFAGRKGCSPEWSPVAGVGHEIDGLAEEFINRFHEQLRLQRVAELHGERERTSQISLCAAPCACTGVGRSTLRT